jgi:hypothetical protein
MIANAGRRWTSKAWVGGGAAPAMILMQLRLLLFAACCVLIPHRHARF